MFGNTLREGDCVERAVLHQRYQLRQRVDCWEEELGEKLFWLLQPLASLYKLHQ
jgi:hypothetical protein